MLTYIATHDAALIALWVLVSAIILTLTTVAAGD